MSGAGVSQKLGPCLTILSQWLIMSFPRRPFPSNFPAKTSAWRWVIQFWSSNRWYTFCGVWMRFDVAFVATPFLILDLWHSCLSRLCVFVVSHYLLFCFLLMQCNRYVMHGWSSNCRVATLSFCMLGAYLPVSWSTVFLWFLSHDGQATRFEILPATQLRVVCIEFVFWIV